MTRFKQVYLSYVFHGEKTELCIKLTQLVKPMRSPAQLGFSNTQTTFQLAFYIHFTFHISYEIENALYNPSMDS